MSPDEQLKLKHFIEAEIGMELGELSTNPLFFDDLGIDGDDAIELMEKLSRTYSFDLSTYDPSKYHLWESEIIFSLPFIPIQVSREIKTFDLAHLLAVIEKGGWFDPA